MFLDQQQSQIVKAELMVKAKNWVERVADKVEEYVRNYKKEGETVVCASGISPSGPIHLGNLREIMTVHLVSEELRARGRRVEHIHSWDDFDRLRKVPQNISEDFSEYIGRPISDVPDPLGEYESYAMRFMSEFEQGMGQLGIRPRYIRQSQAYRRGDYTEKIKLAMKERFKIFDILAQYQTLDRFEDSLDERRSSYYPFKVYCESCGKDFTRITSYDEQEARIDYFCTNDNYAGSFSLNEKVAGKLVWKVDWPMRWSYERVDFEPAGEDHSAPGSSFVVGQQIVRNIFEAAPPYFIGYAFVGMAGRSKISSSAGTGATPATALDIFEPCILRWLYARRNVSQKFDIDFGQEVLRVYDEWDTFCKRVQSDKAGEADRRLYDLCVRTSAGEVNCSELPVPFRLLSSSADITQGNIEQILRIVSAHLDEPRPLDELQRLIEPRLSCAIRWAMNYLPEDERTQIREEPDVDIFDNLTEQQKQGLQILLDNLDEDWSLHGLTRLLYGVPKLLLGLPIDAPPNEGLKQVQREFFITLYLLLCGKDTGPRLPTLFLSIGKERVQRLLSLPVSQGQS